MKNTTNFDKILIIGLLGIGDFLFLVPSIKALKKKYPQSRIHYLTFNKGIADFINSLNFFHKVIISKAGLYEKRSNIYTYIKFIVYSIADIICLRREKYDISMWPVGSITFKMEIYSFFINAKRRLIYKEQKGSFYTLSNRLNEVVISASDLHNSVSRSDLFKIIGIRSINYLDYKITIYNYNDLSNNYNDIVKSIEKYSGIRIGIQPFGKQHFNRGRDYLVSYYIELINKLLQINENIVVILINDEFKLLNKYFSDKFLNHDRILMVFNLTLKEIALIIKKLDIVIGGDSAIPHLANSLGIKSIMINGPTAPWKSGLINQIDNCIRVDIPCSPCWEKNRSIVKKCKNKLCFNLLKPELILEKINSKFNKSHIKHRTIRK